MIRKLEFLAAIALFWAAPRLYAAVDTIEEPIYRHGTPAAVLISTFTYTKVPPSSTLANRTTVLIDNPSTNSAIVHGHIGDCTSTNISTSTVKGPIEIAPASNGGYIDLGPGECLWLVSRNTSAESVTCQEVGKRYAP